MTSPLELDLSVIEAAYLTDLVEQFLQVLTSVGGLGDLTADPAVARLVPAAYRNDDAAAAEFRRLTQSDLLDRRRADAQLVSATLLRDGARLSPDSVDVARPDERLLVVLDRAASDAWLRTLSALRLVLATRLGIQTDDDHVEGDVRFGVYDWLGYRLDGLVRALES
ncbi:DUF2017 family protein [Microbacterium sp.]|uniref:DUF2017 family protein n=1 Tax=Microbacterium sp. TaxID=51671 RepID=UPI0025F6752D|nr:DUF2017 family protein [Microbacterium sp.]